MLSPSSKSKFHETQKNSIWWVPSKQNLTVISPSGMDLKCELADPASAKYTVLENRTTPKNIQVFKQKLTFGEKVIRGRNKVCRTYTIC